jgi:hypothetical protein
MSGIRDALRKARLLERGKGEVIKPLTCSERHEATAQPTDYYNKEAKPKIQCAHINEYDELAIPFDSNARYHYWNGGQSLIETLKELGAGEAIVSKYYH